MFAMMALFDSDLRSEIFTLMELANIKNYTQFMGLSGSSEQGKKEGSVAWPGSNEIMLLIVSEEERQRFSDIVTRFKQERENKPGLLLFHWKLEGIM